jgi:hypothetical protein
MAKVGGARQGAGRKPGTLNRKTVELLHGAVSEGLTPIEYMLQIMRDEDADPKEIHQHRHAAGRNGERGRDGHWFRRQSCCRWRGIAR